MCTFFFWFQILSLSLISSIKNIFATVNIFKLCKFLQKKNPKYTYEIIVVDDGSKDKTTQVKLMHTQGSHSTWKTLNNDITSGKVREFGDFKSKSWENGTKPSKFLELTRNVGFNSKELWSHFEINEKYLEFFEKSWNLSVRKMGTLIRLVGDILGH